MRPDSSLGSRLPGPSWLYLGLVGSGVLGVVNNDGWLSAAGVLVAMYGIVLSVLRFKATRSGA